jgi:hypothetical protein
MRLPCNSPGGTTLTSSHLVSCPETGVATCNKNFDSDFVCRSLHAMVGDVNLFLSQDEEDNDMKTNRTPSSKNDVTTVDYLTSGIQVAWVRGRGN